MNLSAHVWPVFGASLACLQLITAPALAQPGGLSAEGEEMIWWARLFWVLGIVAAFGLFLLAAYWLKFHWLPGRRRGKP